MQASLLSSSSQHLSIVGVGLAPGTAHAYFIIAAKARWKEEGYQHKGEKREMSLTLWVCFPFPSPFGNISLRVCSVSGAKASLHEGFGGQKNLSRRTREKTVALPQREKFVQQII